MTSFRDELLASRLDSPFALLDDRGNLTGPFGLMERLGDLGRSLARLGESVRFHGRLPAAEREAVILHVAGRTGSAYEEWAHRAVVRATGCLEEADVDALCAGAVGRVSHPGARAAATVAGWVLDGADPADRPAAADRYDDEELQEVVVTAHYYAMLAGMMRVAGVGVPAVDDEGALET